MTPAPSHRNGAGNGAVVSRPGPSRQGRAPSAGRSQDAERGGRGDLGERTRRLLSVLRDRRGVVLQALVVVPLAVLAVSLAQAKTYEATAKLLFQDAAIGVDPALPAEDSERAVATREELVLLPVVAQRAAEGLGTDYADVRSRVTVEPSENANLIDVIAVGDSPRSARETADAYADAFLAFRRQVARLQLSATIERAERNLASLPRTGESAARRATLEERLEQLRVARSMESGNAELAQPAQAPSEPVAPRLALNLLLGVIAAAIVGIGLALVLEGLDERPRRPEDLERAYPWPLLAVIPASRSLARAGRRHARGDRTAAEALRTLRANIRYFHSPDDVRSIFVTSASEGEGRSTVARALAHTMAAMGDRVVLVEADLRAPAEGPAQAHASGGATPALNGVDLDDALTGIAVEPDPSRATQAHEPTDDADKLWLLPAGALPSNPSGALDDDGLRSVLSELERRFDVVVIDGPPLSSGGDALPLASAARGLVVVGGLGRTTSQATAGLRQRLSMLGRRPLGVVANLATKGRARSARRARLRGRRARAMAIAGAVLIGELALAAAIADPRLSVLLLPALAVVLMALVFRFPFAAACLFLATTCFALQDDLLSVELGPITIKSHETLLGALLVVAALRPRQRTLGGLPGLALAGFLAMLLLSSLLAVVDGRAPAEDVLAWARPFPPLAFFYVVVRVFPDARTVWKLVGFGAILAAATGAVSLLLSVGVEIGSVLEGAGSNTLRDQGSLNRIRLPGLTIGYMLFWLIVVQFLAARGKRRLLPAALFTGIVLSIALSFNRNMWLGLAFGLVLMLALGGTRIRQRLVAGMAVGLTAIVVAGLFGAGLGPGSAAGPLVERATTLLDPTRVQQSDSLESRARETERAWEVAKQYPWTGVGPGVSYGAFYERAGDDSSRRERQLYVHNQYLYLFLITGVPGLSLFLLFLGSVLRVAWGRATTDLRLTACGVGLAMLMLSSIVAIYFSVTSATVAIALLAGAIIGHARREAGEPAGRPIEPAERRATERPAVLA